MIRRLPLRTSPFPSHRWPISQILTAPESITLDEDNTIALNITASLEDTDGSESLSSVTLSGVPTGVAFGHMVGNTFQELTGVTSVVNGETVWTLSEEQLVGLHMRPPKDYSGNFDIAVSVNRRGKQRHRNSNSHHPRFYHRWPISRI